MIAAKKRSKNFGLEPKVCKIYAGLRFFQEKIMKRFFLLPLLMLALGCKPEAETFNGYVEGEYLYIAPTTSGLLQTLSVSRGQQVKAGDDLFALDQTNLNATLVSAESEVAQANASLEDASSEFDRATRQLASNSISKSDYDSRKAAFETAEAAVQIAQQKTVQTQKQIAESAPKAPGAGYIEDTYFNPGEYIAAGTPVVSFLPPENIRVRFFVPQAKLPLFPFGSLVTLRCDGCKKQMKAVINYIASQSEYTPPVIYSVGSRDKLVFRVEALPESFTPDLRPGLPVDIERDAQ
jgi:HlyD family secretion protein